MTIRPPRPAGRPRPGRALRVVIPLAAAALAAAACSGGGSSGSAATSSAPPPASATSSTGAASSPAAEGTKVTATETEYTIMLSTNTFTPGTYTFVADDTGKATHALTINGPGVQDKSTAKVTGGQSASVTVTLQKGTYELFCPVSNHKQQGMDTHITVS